MARITKVVKGVQNHWKKSLFGAVALAYGGNYVIEKYKINQLMRHFSSKAMAYGDKTQPANQAFGKVVLILNPVADKKYATETFEKYCAPILNLGGLSIDIIKTDSEGHARRYVEELETLPQAILCAGGDGTLSELVTGLFRRSSSQKEIQPTIGVLPLGRQNSVGENWFNFTNSSELERARGLAEASMSIVRGNVVAKDVMKIEVISEDINAPVKPVYAMGTFEWSGFSDAFLERDRYWYFGPLRDYVTFIFNAFNDSIICNRVATITYTDPCAGCNNCYVTPGKYEKKSGYRRWWSGFIPSFRLGSSQSNQNTPDYSKILNTNCKVQKTIEFNSGGIIISSSNVDGPKGSENQPHLSLKLIEAQDGFKFISHSWERLNNNQIHLDQINPIRSVVIVPKQSEHPDQERFFYIDHESYEVMPIRVTLLPKLLNCYAS